MLLVFLSAIETEQDRSFLIALYDDYSQVLFRYAYMYLNNEYDAEDIVHDIFQIVANGYIGNLSSKPAASVRRFLFVCTKNRALNLINHRSKSVSLDSIIEKGFDIPDDSADNSLDDLICEKDILEKAKIAIKSLDPIYGDPLWLSLEGYSNQAISELFSENYETIRKRIYRAKLILKNAILEEGGAA